MQVTMLVWPTERRGNHYASSSAGDMSLVWNSNLKNKATFPRAQCPDCCRGGDKVERQPIKCEVNKSKPQVRRPLRRRATGRNWRFAAPKSSRTQRSDQR